MAEASTRQILILQKIPLLPQSVSTKQLHDYVVNLGIDASERTINRDISNLSRFFPILETPPTGRGREGAGWAMGEMASKDGIPYISPATALSLKLCQQYIEPLLPKIMLNQLSPYFLEADAILKASNGAHHSRWMNKIRIVKKK